MDHEKAYYPKYKEYEIMPGEGVNNEDRWKDYKNNIFQKSMKLKNHYKFTSSPVP